MSASSRKASRAVRVSTRIYQWLLVAYPPSFRHEYSAQMIQVFRDCCREAVHVNGTSGLLRYWPSAFGDLIMSALAERRQEELHMSRTLWIRLGSLAAIVSGSMFALSQITTIVIMLTEAQTGGAVQPFDDTYFQHRAWATTPVIWLLVALALICLRSWGMNGRPDTSERVYLTIGAIGAALIGIGNALIGAVSLTWGLTCVPPGCIIFDNHNFSTVGRLFILVGTTLFACSLILYGIATIRHRLVERRRSRILSAIFGILAVFAWALLNYQMFMANHMAATTYNGSSVLVWVGPPFLNLVWFHAPPNLPVGSDIGNIVFIQFLPVQVFVTIVAMNLLFAVSWILLGVTMWPHRNEQAATQDVLAPVQPAT